MSRELYINGSLLDLSEGTVIALTFQSHDIADLSTRNASFSNKFTIPGTSNNNAVLGFSSLVKSSSTRPYRKLSAKYVENGVELVADGFAIIEQTTGTDYEITVYSGNLDFFGAIEGLMLSDLDLSAFDHVWDFATVQATFTATSGYKYPLIDYGTLEGAGLTVDTRWSRPAFFYDTILRQIFTDAGFTVTGSLLSNADYLKTMLLWATSTPEGLWDNLFGAQITYADWTTPANTPVITGPDAYVNTFDLIGSGTVNQRVYLKIKITNTDPFLPSKYCKIWIVDYFTASYTLIDTVSGDGIHSLYGEMAGAARGYQYGILIEAIGCWVEVVEGRFSGEGVTATDKYFSVAIPTTSAIQTGAVEKYTWAGFANEGTALYFETVAMQNFAPVISQKEFLKAVFNQFNVFPDTDPLKKEVTLHSLDSVIRDRATARDWTDKLQVDEKTSLTFRRGAFGQSSYFQYLDGDEDTAPNLGRGALEVDDETLPREKVVITLPFAPSAMVKRLGSIGTGYMDTALVRMMEDEEFTTPVAPRCLVDDTRNGVLAVTFDEGANSVTTSSNLPLAYFQLLSRDFNLGFDNSLLDDNYAGLAQILASMKVVRVFANLTLADVVGFDFSRLVYAAQFSAYFYVNKISNFRSGELTELELVRV